MFFVVASNAALTISFASTNVFPSSINSLYCFPGSKFPRASANNWFSAFNPAIAAVDDWIAASNFLILPSAAVSEKCSSTAAPKSVTASAAAFTPLFTASTTPILTKKSTNLVSSGNVFFKAFIKFSFSAGPRSTTNFVSLLNAFAVALISSPSSSFESNLKLTLASLTTPAVTTI